MLAPLVLINLRAIPSNLPVTFFYTAFRDACSVSDLERARQTFDTVSFMLER